MFRYMLPLLCAVSLANAQLITVECSDGQAQFEFADLQASKCLRITQKLSSDSQLKLPRIDSRSLALFLKLSKLNDDKIFDFIDSLTPDAFQLIDYHAKYLCFYHELDALFKYKFLREYTLVNARKDLHEFVDSKFFIFKFVDDPKLGISRWQYMNLYDQYIGSQLPLFKFPQNSNVTYDYRAFFVLIDFYQQAMKKPLNLSTQHLKNIFNSFEVVIQRALLNKQLVILP